MFNTIRNAWRIPDLRKKLLYTLLIIIIFRFGSVIPAPFLDASALASLMADAGQNSALGYINMLTGGAFSYASLFAMGITPYINSSIIMQLLTIAIPPLENLAKEGEEGRKKIATITRYVTVVLGLIQGVAYYFYLRSSGIVKYTDRLRRCVRCLRHRADLYRRHRPDHVDGRADQRKGCGQRHFHHPVCRYRRPAAGHFRHRVAVHAAGMQSSSTAGQYLILAPLFIVLFLVVIWVIVFMNEAERRIPVQYAKRVVGRKMYGGQSTFLPVKVAMTGVMPVIFASAILVHPPVHPVLLESL